jgi:hypothetical protein
VKFPDSYLRNKMAMYDLKNEVVEAILASGHGGAKLEAEGYSVRFKARHSLYCTFAIIPCYYFALEHGFLKNKE